MAVKTAKELTVYRRAYELAMRVFEISKRFPAEERYALTGQINGFLLEGPDRRPLIPDS